VLSVRGKVIRRWQGDSMLPDKVPHASKVTREVLAPV